MKSLHKTVLAVMVTASLSACASEPPKLITYVVRESEPVKPIQKEHLSKANVADLASKKLRPIDVDKLIQHNPIEIAGIGSPTGKVLPPKVPPIKPLPKSVPVKPMDKPILVASTSKNKTAIVANALPTLKVSPTKMIIKKESRPLYMIHHNENMLDAISRWIRADGVEDIAWSLPPDVMNKLNKRSVGDRVLNSSLYTSIADLSNEIGSTIRVHFSHANNKKLAAIVPWLGGSKITLVDQPSLKLAVKQLAKSYGWNFIDDNQRGKSYLAVTDFPFPAAYPIATPKHDFEMAIDKLVKDYPVRVELFDGTQTVYVMDEK